ncbi:MAG: glycosyltransferase family 4 protein [candidate division WOR-3 bacterium]
MKRITFVDLSPYRGGAEISLEKLINILVEDFDIKVLVADKRIWNFNKNVKIEKISIKRETLLLKKDLKNLILFLKESVDALKMIDLTSDMIITNTFKSHILIFFYKLKYRNFKWIIFERDMYENGMIKVLKRFIYTFSYQTVFNSNFLKTRYGLKNGKVLYNIVDRVEECAKDFKIFLYFGDPTYEKGYDRIFEVFERIKSVMGDAKLIVIKKETGFFGIEYMKKHDFKEVIFKNYEEVENVLSIASFLLFFNRRTETFSRVVAESMASGVIPLLLKGNGMDDYVKTGYNGLVFEYYDPEVIVKKFFDFYSKEDLTKISKNCQRVVLKCFSSGKIKKDFISLL